MLSPNKSLHKFIQYKLDNDSNLEHIYSDLITLIK